MNRPGRPAGTKKQNRATAPAPDPRAAGIDKKTHTDTVMTQTTRPPRVMLSAGGTGGHIFPALAVADEIRRREPQARILFVGALGRMEMEKVPAAGYEVVGLPVMGMPRRPSPKLLKFAWTLLRGLRAARRVVRGFGPDVAAGFGGYASGPVLFWASRMGVPTVLQEQNSYAGVTNKLLARRARAVCVAYEGMGRFFPPERVQLTGNPVRRAILDAPLGSPEARAQAALHFGLDPALPTVLVLGGSLGARSVNRQVADDLPRYRAMGAQLLWQTGRLYHDEMSARAREAGATPQTGVNVNRFIDRMDLAYALADVIVSRAGAGTISELCVVGKPAVLVPSPNVAEDHQTHNARALADRRAAVLVADADIAQAAVHVERILADKALAAELSANIAALARRDSVELIADNILKHIPQP